MADNVPEKEADRTVSQKNDPESSQDKGSMESANTNNTEVVFNKNVSILTNKPLHHLDKGKIKAFAAVGRNKLSNDLFAMMCDKSMTPRRTASIKYSKVTNSSLVKLVGSGKVYWPPEKSEKFFFIFENTLGKPIISRNEKYPASNWRAEDVMVNIAYPVISVLKNMRDKDLVHSQIWPGNMFYNGMAGAEKISLGECLTVPSASLLPTLYEPIERALANPESRGPGSFADDMYSFGVSLAVILRTSDPMAGMSDEKIIEHKIEKGSYATLLGKERLSGAMLELLRGLLYDDPEQRWTLEDLESWMDGRRLSPKQSPKRVKATRPIIFGGKKYTRPELLAKDAHKHVDEMARLVETGELSQWIDRAIEDKLIKVRLEQVMKDISSYDRTDGYNARLTAAISVALYTECPVYYRSLKFLPAGFGKAFTSAYVQKKEMQDYIDVLRYTFIMPSIRMRKNTGATSQPARFDNARSFINQTTLSSGLERCLYFLDPECPCLSPILENFYVQTPEELLPALDSICENSKPRILFDRHIVSFLSVKDRRNVDPYMRDLTSSEPYRRMLGQIRTLATIQKRSRLDKFPSLAGWIADNLEEVYARFHDAKKRDSIKSHINKIQKMGDLTQIAYIFDDPKLFQGDVGSFYQAMQEYQKLETEKNQIEDLLKNKKNYGQHSGQQVASVISMILSFVIMVLAAYFIIIKG